MSRRAARFTQSELARIFREMGKHEGVAVELLPDGTIRCVQGPKGVGRPQETGNFAAGTIKVF